jgi:hypothetical protein
MLNIQWYESNGILEITWNNLKKKCFKAQIRGNYNIWEPKDKSQSASFVSYFSLNFKRNDYFYGYYSHLQITNLYFLNDVLLGFDLTLSTLARFCAVGFTVSLCRHPRWGNHAPKLWRFARYLLQSGGVTRSTRRRISSTRLRITVGPMLTHHLRGGFQGKRNENLLWSNKIQRNTPLGTGEVHTIGTFGTKICY